MKPLVLTSLLAVLLASSPGSAQDLEPNLQRAAKNLVGELARTLPGWDQPPESLQVLAGRGVDRAAWEVFEDALRGAGFRVVDRAGRRTLGFRVWAERAAPNRRLLVESVEDAPTRFVCDYADTTWMDRPEPDDVIVEGSLARDPDRALASARRKARLRVLRRIGVGMSEGKDLDVLDGLPVATFVAREQAEGAPLYRAFLKVTPTTNQVARLKGRVETRRTLRLLSPWLRVGATLVLGLLLGFFYLRTDLKTRGYMTGRLRLLFGILFLIGTGVCWRIPL